VFPFLCSHNNKQQTTNTGEDGPPLMEGDFFTCLLFNCLPIEEKRAININSPGVL